MRVLGGSFAAALVALGLWGVGDAFLWLFVDVGRSNVCAWGGEEECFTNERGLVESVDGTEMQVRLGENLSRTERLVASDRWDDPPAPGALVVLQRWEDDEIAYVYDPRTGDREQTNGAPDRAGRFVGGLILLGIALLIARAIVLWLLD